MLTQKQAALQADGRWPEGLPRSNQDLHTQYAAFVAMLVNRYNKIDRDPRDLLNQIWLRLIEADVLSKYVEAVSTEPPETMTNDEVHAFLGITLAQFRAYLWNGVRRTDRYIPTPVRGTLFSQKAIWRTADVVKLALFVEEHHCFRKQNPSDIARPKFMKKHFMGYLQRAIHHTFCNYCRTRTRKYQEHLGEDLRAMRDLNEVSSWEESLESYDPVGQDGEVDVRAVLAMVAQVTDDPELREQITALLIDGCNPERLTKKLEGLDAQTKAAILRVFG